MEAGGYRPEISRARANGRVSGLRRDLLLRGTDKVSSLREGWERSEVRKGEAINFYGRKLSHLRGWCRARSRASETRRGI